MILTILIQRDSGTANNKRGSLQAVSKIRRKQRELNLFWCRFVATVST